MGAHLDDKNRRRDGTSSVRSLRGRVLLSFASGVAVVGVSVGGLAALATRAAAHQELDSRAAVAKHIFDSSLEQLRRELRGDAALVAARPGLAEVLSRDYSGDLGRVLDAYRGQKRDDYVSVINGDGLEVFGVGGSTAGGNVLTEHTESHLVEPARRGFPTSDVGVSADGRPSVFAAAPVRMGGRVVGVVVLGEALDRGRLADIARPLNLDLRIETLPTEGLEVAAEETRQASGKERLYSYPLGLDSTAAAEAKLVVSLSTEPLATATRAAVLRAGAAGLVISLGLVVLLAALLTRTAVRPLETLYGGLRRFSQGDYGVRVRVTGARELCRVIDGFNSMAALVGEQQATLASLAASDQLTGLANHRSFHERLEFEVRKAESEGRPLAVVALDLDHFKTINDTWGHPYGDDVLRAVADQLRRTTRREDLVARVGGEEFALILPGRDADEACAVAERARAAVATIRLHKSSLSCSAGVASFPADASAAPALWRRSDGALYWAKRSGRGQTRHYDPAHVSALSVTDQRAEIDELLERPGGIIPVFQPLVHLASGRIAGYEALARFQHATVRPTDGWFIHAHRCGLGADLEAACIRAALRCPDRPAGALLSLNVSPSVLSSSQIRTVLPADLTGLVFEITEHELATDDELLSASLVNLRHRGARIAIDDVGQGYSGLRQLMRVQPDLIKLDRGLVDGVHADQSKAALIECFVEFARRTGAATVAEGIEGLDDLESLADMDVTYGQGYLLARPAAPWASVTPAAAQVLSPRTRRTAVEPTRQPALNGQRRPADPS